MACMNRAGDLVSAASSHARTSAVTEQAKVQGNVVLPVRCMLPAANACQLAPVHTFTIRNIRLDFTAVCISIVRPRIPFPFCICLQTHDERVPGLHGGGSRANA